MALDAAEKAATEAAAESKREVARKMKALGVDCSMSIPGHRPGVVLLPAHKKPWEWKLMTFTSGAE